MWKFRRIGISKSIGILAKFRKTWQNIGMGEAIASMEKHGKTSTVEKWQLGMMDTLTSSLLKEIVNSSLLHITILWSAYKRIETNPRVWTPQLATPPPNSPMAGSSHVVWPQRWKGTYSQRTHVGFKEMWFHQLGGQKELKLKEFTRRENTQGQTCRENPTKKNIINI